MDRKKAPTRRQSEKKKHQRVRKQRYSSTDSDACFIETDPSMTSDSDSDSDELHCYTTRKSIAKRIRKRRRSCTRTNYYESDVSNISEDDILACLGKYL